MSVTTDDFEPYPKPTPSSLATILAAATVLERMHGELTERMRAFPAHERKLLNRTYDTLFRLAGDYHQLAVQLRELPMPPTEGEGK